MTPHTALLAAQSRALMQQGRFADAEIPCRAALDLTPDDAELHFTLGTAQLARGAVMCAQTTLGRAVALDPSHAPALNNLGHALRLQGRHDAAASAYQRALLLQPAHPGMRNNLGSALLALQRPGEAITHLEAAVSLQPDYAEACNNLGGALLAQDRAPEAIAWFRRAAELAPELAEARLGEAIARLSIGDFQAGWPAYEARWDLPELRAIAPASDRPQWRGTTNITGQTILLHAEQGLGDTIQFARYAPLLRARGAHVLLLAPTSLHGLLAPLADQLIDPADPLPAHDVVCPLLSLPLAFATTPDTIPASHPYLRADPALVADWRRRLGSTPAWRVGIAWSGSPDHPEDVLRSIPLSAMLAALHRPDIELHGVQTDIAPADRAALTARPGFTHHADALTDFSDTAALLACMDLVISVDTSVAHLAGAMGRPVWLLLQANADFRWLRQRPDSPWYPTMRLYRRTLGAAWGPTLARVGDDLSEASKPGAARTRQVRSAPSRDGPSPWTLAVKGV
jgi:Flp pilus assembly protein TadD